MNINRWNYREFQYLSTLIGSTYPGDFYDLACDGLYAWHSIAEIMAICSRENLAANTIQSWAAYVWETGQ